MSSREIIFSAAGAAGAPAIYIEDVFSTWLYTGTSANQTITNGIDLAGQGGMVWCKSRSNAFNHSIADTVRGAGYRVISNSTNAQQYFADSLTSFNSNGFSLGTDSSSGFNYLDATYASWTFRKQPKFFDVVTYTGNGSVQNISHSLGSVPAFIITKNLAAGSWWCYHKDLGNATTIRLNSTNASNADATIWNSTTPTSTQFTVGASASSNNNGATYVAYLFAHNAGGFGLTGTDNVISCGSFTTNGSGEATINLGYEPQWVMVKATGSADQWAIVDVLRGFNQTQYNQLSANSSASENTGSLWNPTATGFYYGIGAPSATYIYMAIRRGPMKTPTSGTSVFKPTNQDDDLITTNFVVDAFIENSKNGNAFNSLVGARLIGNNSLTTSNTSAESVGNFTSTVFQSNTSYGPNFFGAGAGGVEYAFARAPGFFDVVCYTGDGTTNRQVTHNLGVTPQMIIVKARTGASAGVLPWIVGDVGLNSFPFQELVLNTANATGFVDNNNRVSDATATYITVNSNSNINQNDYVAYLFASVLGVSSVSSYTGTGGTQTINCGFTTGARFVLIKRADATGNWWVWDTARGMVAGTDPRLALNSTAAEINNNWVYTVTNGFQIVTSDATVNASGGTYIYLAIA